MKRQWIYLACTAAAAMLAAAAWRYLAGNIPVDVVRVAPGRVEEITSSVSAGTVKSFREAVLATETGGRIDEVLVREGSTVRRGDVLARMGDPELARQEEASRAEEEQARAALLQAEARREEAELRVRAEQARSENNVRKSREDHRRAAELFRDGFLSRSEMETAETLLANSEEEARIASAGWATVRAIDREIDLLRARRDAARARTAALAARRAKLVITAPFPGVITKKSAEIGESKLPGAVLFIVADPTASYVEAQIDEADAAKLRVGQSVRLVPEAYRSSRVAGRIIEIRPTVEASKEVSRANTIAIAAEKGAPPLRLGMSVDVEVQTGGKDNVLQLPSAALMERDGKKFVYTVSGNRVVRREVATGLSNWDRTEILSGVASGEEVITSLEIKELSPGSRVAIRSRR